MSKDRERIIMGAPPWDPTEPHTIAIVLELRSDDTVHTLLERAGALLAAHGLTRKP
jgi:hypothetical protein